MGYLGVTTDWSTIQAMQETVDEKGRCLQVERGGSGAVADGVEDATADACRADAMAAIVLGEPCAVSPTRSHWSTARPRSVLPIEPDPSPAEPEPPIPDDPPPF
jgi:hypothetical protein